MPRILQWRPVAAAIALAVVPVVALPPPAVAAERFDDRREALRYRLEFDAADQVVTAAGEPIHALHTLRRFYTARLFEPAWGSGRAITRLLEAVRTSATHGLNPDDYHLGAIEVLLEQRKTGRRRAVGFRVDLELLLTDAFLLLGSHLHSGRLDPLALEPAWTAQRSELDMVPVLEQALANDDVAAALAGLAPSQAGYQALREALAVYRQAQADGGWPTIPAGPALKPGTADERVPLLRQRLVSTATLWGDGELAPAPSGDVNVYNDELVQAVKAFQRRHGLDPDGVVGSGTLSALNASAADRVDRIRVNLERWRWLPPQLGEPHIEVNIAAYALDLIEGGRSVLHSEVIVGRNYRQTPVFSGRMTYLVLNPYWEVPPSLARRDVLPKIKAQPDFVDKMGFDVLQGWGASEQKIDPSTIDWASLSERNFPYRLRQAPGPLNALGQVKFMFPNPHNVYLHDTPSRELFSKGRRDFSSGCIRVAKPLELTTNLLAANGDWPRERIDRVLASGRNSQTVPLKRPVDVHLLYWTAWSSGGAIHFREDIYNRDPPVLQALTAPPPAPRIEARR